MHMHTDELVDEKVEAEAGARRGRARRRNVALGGLIGGAAIFSSGCTLSDISTILSILRLLGVIG
jgi:hypothetical protein